MLMRVRVFKIWQIVKFYLFKSLKKIHKSLKHTSKYISHHTSPIFAKVSKSYRQYIHPYLYPIYRRTLGPIIKLLVNFISHIYKKIRRLLKSHKFKAHARFFKLGFEAVILVAVIVGGYKYITRPNYNISSSAQKIIGTPDISLASKFVSYSKADKSYYLNKKAIGQKAIPNTIQVGSSSGAAYSYKAPVDISRSEMTFYDNTNNLSFSITPSFKTASGKYKNGEIIYPMSKGQQAVYSIKDNGVKEDIILNKNLGDKTSLDFKLNLPDTLSAKLMPSGAVGIYSASPMLLGNVSASSSSDQALLKKARTSSAKDTLQFVLMPPTVASSKNSDEEKERAKTKAQFALNGNNLTIKASGLSKLTYPISIDPTVVVSSALTSGNNESNANITSSSISTNSLTGGSIGSWTSASTFAGGMPARQNFGTAVYNGYIYVIGGQAAASSGDCTANNAGNYYCNGTWYAQINANGTIGSWTSAGTFASGMPARSGLGTAVYNGYIYALGGQAAASSGDCTATNYNCNGTWYSKISNPGSINAFSSATGPGTLFMPAVTVYQNYLYVIGGCNLASTVNRWCSASTNVSTSIYYSKINSNDGTLSAPSCGSPVGVWCLSPNVLSVGVFGASAIGYNSTIYVSTGCNGTGVANNQSCSTVINNFQYFLANTTDGSPGSVTNNTAAQLSGNQSGTFGSGLAISNGYLIVAGGCISNSNAAQYMCGRSAGALASSNVYYQLLPTGGGALSAFTQSNYTVAGVFAPAVAAYNGYLYVAGGCAGNNVTTAGKGCSTSGAAYNYLQYAKVSDIVNPSSPATAFTNDTSHAMPSFFAGGMSIYNGYIYVYGGCSDTTSSGSGITAGGYTGCGSSSVSPFTANVLNTVYAAPINLSNGAPSSNFVSVGTMANKSWGFGSAMSNGTIYMIGGCSTYTSTTGGACASPATFSSNYQLATINLGGNGTLKAPTTCASTITNSFCDSGVALGSSASHTITGVSSTAYNGFLYEVGGTDSLTGDTTRCLFTSVSTTSLPYLSNGGTYCNTVRVYSITSPNPVYVASYPMRFAKTGASVSAYNGYIYVTGGNSCTYAGCNQFNDVQVAKINIDGSLGVFSNTTPVSTWPASSSQYACITNSSTYCSPSSGGICSIAGSTYCLLITTAGNNSYLNPGIDQSSASYSLGNVVYSNSNSNYYACKISTCSDNPSTPGTTNWLLLKNYNTYFDTSVCDSSHDCTGGISSYNSSNSNFVNNSISFIDNGYLFATNSNGYSDYSVKINSDGTLSSTGQTLTSSGLAGSTSRAYYKGYEYVLGGTSTSSSLAYVQVSSGTYSSAWKLQSTNSNSLFDAYQLSNASLFASNGYLYVMGGTSSITGASNACNNTATSTTSCNFVAKAPIFSDGSLGDFQYAGTLPSITVTTNLGASVYNGYVYLPNPGTGGTDIWYSGLQSIAHNGIYSYLFNSLTSVTPFGLTVSGTSGKYDDLVTYKPMGDSANVCSGPPTNITPVLSSYYSIAMPTGNTCTNNKTTSQYYLLTVNINDSSVFTFSTYSPSNITGFTLFYHPNSGSRLRGGIDGAAGSVQGASGNLQTLDTPR